MSEMKAVRDQAVRLDNAESRTQNVVYDPVEIDRNSLPTRMQDPARSVRTQEESTSTFPSQPRPQSHQSYDRPIFSSAAQINCHETPVPKCEVPVISKPDYSSIVGRNAGSEYGIRRQKIVFEQEEVLSARAVPKKPATFTSQSHTSTATTSLESSSSARFPLSSAEPQQSATSDSFRNTTVSGRGWCTSQEGLKSLPRQQVYSRTSLKSSVPKEKLNPTKGLHLRISQTNGRPSPPTQPIREMKSTILKNDRNTRISPLATDAARQNSTFLNQASISIRGSNTAGPKAEQVPRARILKVPLQQGFVQNLPAAVGSFRPSVGPKVNEVRRASASAGRIILPAVSDGPHRHTPIRRGGRIGSEPKFSLASDASHLKSLVSPKRAPDARFASNPNPSVNASRVQPKIHPLAERRRQDASRAFSDNSQRIASGADLTPVRRFPGVKQPARKQNSSSPNEKSYQIPGNIYNGSAGGEPHKTRSLASAHRIPNHGPSKLDRGRSHPEQHHTSRSPQAQHSTDTLPEPRPFDEKTFKSTEPINENLNSPEALDTFSTSEPVPQEDLTHDLGAASNLVERDQKIDNNDDSQSSDRATQNATKASSEDHSGPSPVDDTDEFDHGVHNQIPEKNESSQARDGEIRLSRSTSPHDGSRPDEDGHNNHDQYDSGTNLDSDMPILESPIFDNGRELSLPTDWGDHDLDHGIGLNASERIGSDVPNTSDVEPDIFTDQNLHNNRDYMDAADDNNSSDESAANVPDDPGLMDSFELDKGDLDVSDDRVGSPGLDFGRETGGENDLPGEEAHQNEDECLWDRTYDGASQGSHNESGDIPFELDEHEDNIHDEEDLEDEQQDHAATPFPDDLELDGYDTQDHYEDGIHDDHDTQDHYEDGIHDDHDTQDRYEDNIHDDHDTQDQNEDNIYDDHENYVYDHDEFDDHDGGDFQEQHHDDDAQQQVFDDVEDNMEFDSYAQSGDDYFVDYDNAESPPLNDGGYYDELDGINESYPESAYIDDGCVDGGGFIEDDVEGYNYN